MILIWRGLIWAVGALSVAALLDAAMDLEVAPGFRAALNAYDAMTAMALAPVEPWIVRLLAQARAVFGGGSVLLPHWTHVFVVVLLHLFPRVDGMSGTVGAAAVLLWVLQALGAVLVAAPVAAYVGSAPFVAPGSEQGFFVGVFVASAFAISISSGLRDFDETDEEKSARLEREGRWWARQRLIWAIRVVSILAALGALVLVGAAGLIAWRTVQVGFVILGVVWVIAFLVHTLYRVAFSPRDEYDAAVEANGLLWNVALLFMLVSVFVIADAITPNAAGYFVAMVMFLPAIAVAGLFHLGRGWLRRVLGQDDLAPSPASTPALGVFLLGAVLIAVAGLWAA